MLLSTQTPDSPVLVDWPGLACAAIVAAILTYDSVRPRRLAPSH